MTVELVRNPDILAEAGQQKGKKILVGFAAETEDLLQNAREKLQKKNLDLIVSNDIRIGFAGESNKVTLLDREGNIEELPELPKREVAHRILDRVIALRRDEGR